MEPNAFDRLSRALSTAGSRRAALEILLAGTALWMAGGQRAVAQDCLANHVDCHTDEECCSGRCKRKRDGKKLCKPAENQGLCTIKQDICAGSSDICGSGTIGDPCPCFVTKGGRSFCGDSPVIQSGDCDCKSNMECKRRIGKGAKCVQVSPLCTDCPGSTTGCMAPCAHPGPE
jgi:hypothetical protein